MIRSWRNAASEKVWLGDRPRQFSGLDFDAATELLSALNVAKALNDLSPLKSVGLHKLKGDRKGQWAMTVNARGEYVLNSGEPTPSTSRLSIITEVSDDTHCPSRSPAEAGTGGAKVER